jgi:hypothetical protein
MTFSADPMPRRSRVSPYQREVPATGFVIYCRNDRAALLIDAAKYLAAGTIQLPSNPQMEGARYEVASTCAVLSVTWTCLNGVVVNAPGYIGIGHTVQFVWVTQSSTWVCISSSAPRLFMPPIAANFSQIGFLSGAALSTTSNGLQLHAPTTQFNPAICALSAPATPYSVFMRCETIASMNQFNQTGMILMASSGGHFLTFGPSSRQNHPSWELVIDFDRWNSPTSYSSTPLLYEIWTPPSWLRADVTSTTITFFIGFDGLGWEQIYTETIATFLSSVTLAGFFAIGSTNGTSDLFVQQWNVG